MQIQEYTPESIKDQFKQICITWKVKEASFWGGDKDYIDEKIKYFEGDSEQLDFELDMLEYKLHYVLNHEWKTYHIVDKYQNNYRNIIDNIQDSDNCNEHFQFQEKIEQIIGEILGHIVLECIGTAELNIS